MATPKSKVNLATAACNSKIKVKLLVDKKSKKVLFAEASKQFVDFLFCLMSLPLGSIVKLLTQNYGMVGCIGDLYDSIESLSQTNYVQPTKSVESTLNPKAPNLAFENPLLLCNTDNKDIRRKAYVCPNLNQNYDGGFHSFGGRSHAYVADHSNTLCPSCQRGMCNELQFVAQPDSAKQGVAASAGGGGFVKDVVTYMVMDNLEVKPMSTISSITLINILNVQDLSSLKEVVVDVGLAEGMEILRASLKSKNVLTDVFLPIKEAEQKS